MRSQPLQALALLVGTIIGVGVFTIPYVSVSAGFWPTTFQILVLALLTLSVHLAYGDVVMATSVRHRLPGYTRIYLGRTWGRISTISHLLGLTGSLTAYVILGSIFLHTFIAYFWPPFTLFSAAGIFFSIGLIIFFYDSSLSTTVELILTLLLVVALLGFIFLGAVNGRFEFLETADLTKTPLSYGVILFALSGSVVIPRVYETFRGNHSDFRRVLIVGTLAPAILYIAFVGAVFATSPAGVSPEAIRGMVPLLGQWAILLGSLVGFLATITSYIGVGLSQKGLLQFDLGFSKSLAWILTVFTPFILIFFGVSNFIALIGFVGALAIGFDNIVIAHIWRRLPHHLLFRVIPHVLSWVLTIAFGAGMIYEVWHVVGF